MKHLREEWEDRLKKLQAEGLYRRMSLPGGLDFSSNDYLGLSRDARFQLAFLERLQESAGKSALAAPASRLLRGNTAHHEAVEAQLARFKGTASALLFPSGYQANVGLLSALIDPEDRVLSDEQNHASIIDGLRLSRCKKMIFPHLDWQALERSLAQPSSGRTFVVTESLFSMDGDLAPLDRYAELADKYGAYLIVDDAHATGVFGRERGSGLTEQFAVERQATAIVSTLGKAFGLFGAFVAGSDLLIDYLTNRCRAFIFSTAVPPLLLFGIETALDHLSAHPSLRERVCARADRLRRRLGEAGMNTLRSCGPIVPVVLGSNERALQIAEQLQQQGFDVRAIRPPTVAAGTARLRISVHADHSEEDIDKLAEALIQCVQHVTDKQS